MGRRVVVYVGALGGWYLTEEMVQFLATAHEQDPSWRQVADDVPGHILRDAIALRATSSDCYGDADTRIFAAPRNWNAHHHVVAVADGRRSATV